MSTTRNFVDVNSLGDTIYIRIAKLSMALAAHTRLERRFTVISYKSISNILLGVLSSERSTYNRENTATKINVLSCKANCELAGPVTNNDYTTSIRTAGIRLTFVH